MKLTTIALATAVLALPLAVVAQQTTPAVPNPDPNHTTYQERHDINGRAVNQQDRIAQGVKSGQLTPGETSHLEGQEAHINQEDKNMRAADDGHLTAADRHKLARQQNRESDRIYKDKHNAKKF